ncbi:MAG: NUDIX domain-containing protein [Bacteroidota bacterium]
MAHIRFHYCPLCTSPLKDGAQGYNYCTSQACNYVQYQNPTPVVAAVVEYGTEQVVLGHNRSWPQGWFGLITGFLEKHEHPDECVIREVKEEIGLDVELKGLIGHYTFKRMNQIIIAYHVQGSGEIILDDELDEVRVVPFSLVKYWPSGTGFALRDHLVSRGFSPTERPFK